MKCTQTNEEWLSAYYGEDIVDMSKYSQSDSKDLKAADFIGKNLKVKGKGIGPECHEHKNLV
jgi:hypothetical protein